MTHRLGRTASLATALAALLTLVALGPAAAADSSVSATVSRIQSAEKYALSLLNCTRTGGWVRKDGTCKNRGSGMHSAYRAPLRLHKAVSTKVAFPWARALAKHDVCGHSIAGWPTLSRRMAKNGFKSYYYGENVGCGWGKWDPKELVLRTHLAFQSEKAARGGHWRNLKKKRFKSVGVGVAVGYGRVMVVYEFYGKRW